MPAVNQQIQGGQINICRGGGGGASLGLVKGSVREK